MSLAVPLQQLRRSGISQCTDACATFAFLLFVILAAIVQVVTKAAPPESERVPDCKAYAAEAFQRFAGQHSLLAPGLKDLPKYGRQQLERAFVSRGASVIKKRLQRGDVLETRFTWLWSRFTA